MLLNDYEEKQALIYRLRRNGQYGGEIHTGFVSRPGHGNMASFDLVLLNSHSGEDVDHPVLGSTLLVAFLRCR